MSEWTFSIRDRVTRREVSKLYGGAWYGGIEPSAQTPNVFVYSDPAVGAIYGYDFDGWDETGTAFYYTGEGRVGDQQMTDGNAAILNHVEDKRALRVFEATDDTLPNSSTKLHEYIGEFVVDFDEPFRIADALDTEGDLRTVFVFKLRPVGEAVRHKDSKSEVLDEAQTRSELVDVEAHVVDEFEQSRSAESVTAKRRESELVTEYRLFLESQSHEVRRNRLTSAKTVSPIWTDLYDVTDRVLYEAKPSASRSAIRMAIGQLLDYRRYMIKEDPQLALLLPARPNEEMLSLLADLSIQTVYRKSPGMFVWE